MVHWWVLGHSGPRKGQKTTYFGITKIQQHLRLHFLGLGIEADRLKLCVRETDEFSFLHNTLLQTQHLHHPHRTVEPWYLFLYLFFSSSIALVCASS
jgi:hypothetical protein